MERKETEQKAMADLFAKRVSGLAVGPLIRYLTERGC